MPIIVTHGFCVLCFGLGFLFVICEFKIKLMIDELTIIESYKIPHEWHISLDVGSQKLNNYYFYLFEDRLT